MSFTENSNVLKSYLCTHIWPPDKHVISLFCWVKLHNRDTKIKVQFLCVQYCNWEINSDPCGPRLFKVIAFSTHQRVQRTFRVWSVWKKWNIFSDVTRICSHFVWFPQKKLHETHFSLVNKHDRFQLPVLQFGQWNNESTVWHTEELKAIVMNVRVKTRRTNSFEILSQREMVVKVKEKKASALQWRGVELNLAGGKSHRGVTGHLSLSKNWMGALSVESSGQTVRNQAGS